MTIKRVLVVGEAQENVWKPMKNSPSRDCNQPSAAVTETAAKPESEAATSARWRREAHSIVREWIGWERQGSSTSADEIDALLDELGLSPLPEPPK